MPTKKKTIVTPPKPKPYFVVELRTRLYIREDDLVSAMEKGKSAITLTPGAGITVVDSTATIRKGSRDYDSD